MRIPTKTTSQLLFGAGVTPGFQKFVLAALLVLAAGGSFGQVYSAGAYAGGVTYYPSRWVVGPPPFRIGLEEYSYSTDAAGYILMSRATQRGDTSHRRTRILLGPISFSVPLRPLAVAIIGGGLALTIGFHVATLRLRAYKKRRDEIVEA
jgi:hypothetical protein